MSTAEDLADALARDTLEVMERTGDEGLPDEIANSLGASSPTTEEAFRTAMRVRLAECRARRLLESKRGGAA